LRNPKGLTVIPEERDAWAFLDAAAITSSREPRAVIELVRGLKNAQLWTKMKAIYPFVGGTATTHKWNLKDPQDTDAAFRLTLNGGWTHASTGATPNGTNAYANTYFQTNTLATNNASLSYYSRTNILVDDAIELGAANTNDPASMVCFNFNLSNIDYGSLSRISTSFAANLYSPANTLGYMVATSLAANNSKTYFNNVLGFTNTNNSATVGVRRIYLGAGNYTPLNINDGTAQFFSTKECAFATIGDGLTDTDATALYNIVQRFQTSLGRQV
jgi:hypothetical protein